MKVVCPECNTTYIYAKTGISFICLQCCRNWFPRVNDLTEDRKAALRTEKELCQKKADSWHRFLTVALFFLTLAMFVGSVYIFLHYVYFSYRAIHKGDFYVGISMILFFGSVAPVIFSSKQGMQLAKKLAGYKTIYNFIDSPYILEEYDGPTYTGSDSHAPPTKHIRN